MLNLTDNTTVEDIIRHLANMGIMDKEAHEAHHYAVSWLMSMVTNASSSCPKESATTSEILSCLREHPNICSEDEPLMMELHMWTPSPNNFSSHPPQLKRKRDSSAPSRGVVPYHQRNPKLETIGLLIHWTTPVYPIKLWAWAHPASTSTTML